MIPHRRVVCIFSRAEAIDRAHFGYLFVFEPTECGDIRLRVLSGPVRCVHATFAIFSVARPVPDRDQGAGPEINK